MSMPHANTSWLWIQINGTEKVLGFQLYGTDMFDDRMYPYIAFAAL
jgi:hypothetical protein